MSKFVDYIETKNAIEALQKKLATLSENETVQRANEFKEKLSALMDEYGFSATDVLRMWNLESGTGDSGGERKRSTRTLKTYRNPKTGEEVKTRGGNHKTLNAWRKKYGKEAVNSWAS
ncbi:MAG: H-NS histone [unclassified Hahellaceae]|nr:H-NS histone [Hahellaceae bacterium]|tara:strand:+ start:46354 stop:46707 length:354 start_codon:yes stop_codon:yes gene_type:complete